MKENDTNNTSAPTFQLSDGRGAKKTRSTPAGKRVSFYLDNEALNILNSYTQIKGMKISHVVNGLLRLLADTEENPMYESIYLDVRRFFSRNATKQSTEFLKKNIPSCLKPIKSGALEQFKENTLFWMDTYCKVGVLAILDPIADNGRMLGNAVYLKAFHELEDLVLVIMHDANLPPKITEGLSRINIYPTSTTSSLAIIEQRLNEHDIAKD